MALKKIQKIFYYSNESNKKFIESRIEDMAKKEQRSESFIIEKLILEGLLPENAEAKNIIRNYLYADNEASGVKNALNASFSNNAAGTNWNSKYSNFKPLIEFCVQHSGSNPIREEQEGNVQYMLSLFRDIIVRIEEFRDVCIESFERKMYSIQLEKANVLMDAAKKTPEHIAFKNHFQLILDCWDMLDDWTITYRYLCALTVLCDFNEDTDAKSALCDVISKISKEW